MSNGELQTQQTDKHNSVRKTRIRKGLQRTLNTEKYQTIVIHDEIEEEFEWTSLKEREAKMRNWETLLIQNFKIFHDQVLDELGLQHKKAYFKDDPNTLGPATPNAINDLDSLDSLE